MPESTPKVAVIGSGYWGRNLVRNYHQLGALKLICDKNDAVLEDFNRQYPEVETCLALADITSRADIAGVVIATPAETHFDIAREVLLAGKHVYVEKPLVLDEAQGERLIALARERKRVLMVGHLLHYHPAFVRLKEMVKAGELGRINYIYSNRLNLGKIRREENALWSFAPHDIAMILSLAGEFPERISATGGCYLHQRIADVTTTHLEFATGLRAHIFVSWLHPFKEQKLVVVGDRKMAVFDDTLPWDDKLVLYPHRIDWKNSLPVPTKADPERVAVVQKEPLRQECEHFLDCMTTGRDPITNGEEGLQVLRVLNAAQHSLDNPHPLGVTPHPSLVTPAKAGVQYPDATGDSGVRRNDGAGQKEPETALNEPSTVARKPETEPNEPSTVTQPLGVIPAKAGVQSQHPTGDSAFRRNDRAGQNEPSIGNRESETEPNEPSIGNREPETALKEPSIGNREPETEPNEPSIGNRESETVFIHHTAIIDDDCRIGANTKIWHFSHVLSGSKIGERCNIGQNVVIGPEVTIGRQCKIQNNVSVYKGVTLEDGVFCGPSMVFTNIFNPRAEIGRMDQVRGTLVKRGATLGANCTIVCGHTIGEYAFIGAGAVVTRDVPDHSLVAGNPARQIGWMCRCGEKLPENLTCLTCQATYKKTETGLKKGSA